MAALAPVTSISVPGGKPAAAAAALSPVMSALVPWENPAVTVAVILPVEKQPPPS